MQQDGNEKRFFRQNREAGGAPAPFENLKSSAPPRELPAEHGNGGKKGKKQRVPGFLCIRYDGRELIRLGALLLLILSAYELYIRLDDLRRVIAGIRYACAELGVSEMKFISLLFEAEEMKEYTGILVYLLLCCVLAVLGVILGNRPKAAAFVLLPLTAAVLAAGFFSAGTLTLDFSVFLQAIKLLPFLLILAGTAVNLLEERIAKRYGQNGNMPARPR